ncbi:MAG: ABC transporter [Epsilonproteobacteria bacterium]|nr:ABC transporter [Campylobacterota bacterium]NPA64901.1 metal ABC transporter ATP-binding protein [Campylobacterota bacterium]
MPSVAVDIRHLSFRYDEEYVLEDITAQIYDREYIAIIGPNGGGKSTLLKLILGLLRPTKGEILIYGQPPEKKRTIIGYLPQNINFNLDIPLTAKTIILQGRLSRNKLFYDPQDYEALESVAHKLKISHLLHTKISHLSGGERQKVLLARALVTEPKLLVLDEPTASVDLGAQKEIYAILKELDMTKIVVSHDINIILEGVDRVFYINRKLFIHDNIELKITPREGHFCEMELFEELKRSCDA